MLIGIELPPEQPIVDDDLRSRLEIVRPDVVKVRFADPDYLRALVEVLPEVRLLARPTAEGYTRAEIVEGYRSTVAGFRQAGLMDRLVGYEVGNEPNFTGGPWGPDGAAGYAEDLAAALQEIGEPALPLVSPGLQPYAASRAYARILDRFGWRWRGAHCYWQGERVAEGVHEAVAQAGSAPVTRIVVTEIGDASDGEPAAIRADRCAGAVASFARRGVALAVLFILRADNWPQFVYPPDIVRRILDAGRNARPAEAKLEGSMSAFTVGPGVTEALRQNNDRALTDERWIGDWKSETLGERGIYHYFKQANRVVFQPAQ